MELKVYLDLPNIERKKIRLKRDIKSRARTKKSILKQYTNSVEPMYIKYTEKTKKYADVIIRKKNIQDDISFKMVSEKINEIIK